MANSERQAAVLSAVGDSETAKDERFIVWFDIDNTLYSASTNIAQAMGQRIHAYFVSLGLSDEEATDLNLHYYSTYGLALRGLVRYHNIDPLDFDRKCDGSLPLEELLRPNPTLRKLLQDIDKTKARVWALTNAYRPHAERVLHTLDLYDQIDGLVYCHYEEPDFVCKPDPEYYHKALRQANVTDPSKCLFVDDNRGNIDAAVGLGWGRCVHFCERGPGVESVLEGKFKEMDDERLPGAAGPDTVVQISDLEELRVLWSDIFRQ